MHNIGGEAYSMSKVIFILRPHLQKDRQPEFRYTCMLLEFINSQSFVFRFGDLNVTVTVKRQAILQDVQHEQHVMKFKKFIMDYMYEEWYLVTPVPRQMMADLPVRLCHFCPLVHNLLGRLRFLPEYELWLHRTATVCYISS